MIHDRYNTRIHCRTGTRIHEGKGARIHDRIECANPPLGFTFKSASILCGDQYIRQHQETFFFHQQIFLGVPQGGVNHKKVEFQSYRNNMFLRQGDQIELIPCALSQAS